MKKVTLEITFDDTKGYKGHGDNTADLIKNAIEKELEFELEPDGVVKSGWEVKVVDNNNTEAWLQKRIFEEQAKYEQSCDVVEKASNGGKKKAYSEVLEYIKTH